MAANSLSKPQGAPFQFPGFQGTGFTSGVSEEQRAAAEAEARRQMRQQMGFAGATATGPGGVSITGERKNSGRDQSAQAAFDFFVQVKGMSPQQAEAKVRQYLSNPKKKFNKIKGFKKWLKQGSGVDYNLRVNKKGKIKPTNKYIGADYQESQASAGQRDMINNANQAGLNQVMSLMPFIGQDVGESVDFRRAMRARTMADLDAQNSEGVTAAQQNALDSMANAAINKYSDTFNDNVKGVIGRLQNSGALRSSLIGENLKRGAFDSFGDFLTNLQGQIADQGQKYLNDAASRNQMRINNLNTATAAGGQGALSQLWSPYMNPNSLGLATDPQAASILLQKQGLDQKGRLATGAQVLNAQLTPTLTPNDAGGGFLGIF